MTLNDALRPYSTAFFGLLLIFLAILVAVVAWRLLVPLWKKSAPKSSLPSLNSGQISTSVTPPFAAVPTPESAGPAARLYVQAPLSPAENACYKFLDELFKGEYRIWVKAPLRDVIKRYGRLERELYTMHNLGHIDFLLVQPETQQPVLAIELDDKTHDRPDRQDADRRKNELLARAGLPLVRIRKGRYWGVDEQRLILDAITAAHR